MPSVIGELRFSFVWVESFLDPVLGKSAKAPRAYLGVPQDYTEVFRRVLGGVFQDPALDAPDIVAYSRGFWHYYTGHVGRPRAAEAWRDAIPLYVKLPVLCASPASSNQLDVHAYLYPFAMAVEVSGDFGSDSTKTLELDAAVDLAQAVKSQKLSVLWHGQEVAERSLESLSTEALGRLRSETLGTNAAEENGLIKPLSVVTFVLVGGEDPKVKVVQGTPVHQALQGLASWSSDWRNSAILSLEDKRPDIKSSSPPAYILYSTRRARVGWFPSQPSYADPQNERFRAYHRNQVFTVMQLEALTGFVRRSAERIDQGKRTPLEEKYSLIVAQIIGRMYGGSLSTYRSESNKFYIDQNNLKGPVNRVLKWGGKPELFIPPHGGG
jgi:hypothetical protein